MLKKRIIAVVLVKDDIVVQSNRFATYLPVGKPSISVEFFNKWGADEIVLLDITASRQGRPPNYKMVESAAKNCRVPLTVGGGINNISQISHLMQCGADKVCLNNASLSDSKIISSAASKYGDQCIVVSIDVKKTKDGDKVYDYLRRQDLTKSPNELAKHYQDSGAGEIFINSVDRDGTYEGFDLNLINSVCKSVKIPVICCGGAGNANHFLEVFTQTKVSAASAANMLHFTEHSITTIKSLISSKAIVRHETYFDYSNATFDDAGRLLKKDDIELEKMLFERIEKEII